MLLAAGEQFLAAHDCRLHLRRRSTADVITRIHRTFQRQHGKHVLLDLVAELAQLPKAKALLARLNEMPNAQKVEADRQAALPAFMAMIAAKK